MRRRVWRLVAWFLLEDGICLEIIKNGDVVKGPVIRPVEVHMRSVMTSSAR